MRLYHGTNVDFDVIDITKSQKFKDFGQGFYLTDIYTQAEELAKKKARLFGGSPVVQVYEFDEVCLNTSRLKVCLFKEELIASGLNLFSRIEIRNTPTLNMVMILL